MTAAPTYEVLAIRYAERDAALSEVYYGWPVYGEPDALIRMTYYFWVLLPPTGAPIVVDSGFDPALAARKGRSCECPPGEALARLGIDPAAVEHVVVTHLHFDHIGNLDLFPNARFVVAQRELDFWGTAVARRLHFAHHTDPGAVGRLLGAARAGRVRAVDDQIEVAPGVIATRVGGHSPGQLVLSIATDGAGVVLASDAVHYYDELAKDRPFAVVADLADAYRAFDTVRALSADGRIFVPAHDPQVMERHPTIATGPVGDLAVRIA
jgi:glyoxylase-like metal-dependent hydrolase (beta-lactamase superfamily II)